MKYNGEIIELFGEKLLLHERCIKDSDDLDEFIKSINNWDRQTENYIGVTILQKALKFNIERLPYISYKGKKYPLRPYRLRKLKKLLSEEYIYNNLGIGTLKRLVDKVRFGLEKQKRTTEKGDEISRANRIQLVAKYSNMSWNEVEKLSVSEFIIRLEQAINMLNAEITGKFGVVSQADEIKEWEKVYDHFYPGNDTVN